MFVRAVIVLLVALNLGVAAWWVLQSDPAPTQPAAQPPGIPKLQLLRETRSPPSSSNASSQMATNLAAGVAPASSTAATQCFSLGPFTDATALRAASTRLQPQVVRLRVRTEAATAARGYNVVLPPFASRGLAQAAATRLVAAGFNDLLLINDGPDANGIALGRYGLLEAASRHQAALQAAGFPAQLRPIGGATSQWLDLEVPAGFDIATARIGSGATQQQAVDCASLG